MRYELLLQAPGPGEPFDAGKVDAALATRPSRDRPDGTRLWRLKSGEVEVRPLVEGGVRIATELRVPLGDRLELVREAVVEGAALAAEAGARLFDPQLGRAISDKDEGAVADQYFRTARYAGEMAGVSEAIGTGMKPVEEGLKPATKVVLALGAFFLLVYLLIDAVL